jgi:hypothetical protein
LCDALSATVKSSEPVFINYGASLALKGYFYNKALENSQQLPENELEELDWEKTNTLLPCKGAFRIFICQKKYATQLGDKLKEKYEVTIKERAGGSLLEISSKN